ncbi:MAG: sigma factor-like helix-turn-helix DNA-binding protein [Patescibacteria group bacterium UBA2163]
MSTINFKPKTVVKRLIQVLPERSRDVITARYALNGQKKPETLDAIGKRYGVTRERVRQIENHAVKLIQESEVLLAEAESFGALENAIRDLGGVLTEDMIIDTLAQDDDSKNHLYFLLVVGHPFKVAKEDKDLTKRWYVDGEIAQAVESALKEVHKKVRPSDVLSEKELVTHVKACLDRVSAKYREGDTILRWLELSRCLVRNPLGEWGHASAPGIKVKNIRDYAYLAMKRQGSPMHFREIAKAIRELFGKKAHEATTHNELIKDDRFVLVGRGMYALSEWGYRTGPVAEIIEHILKEHGPLSKDEVLQKVKEERWVKDNTVYVNLQSPRFVKKGGKYSLA